MAKRIIDFNEGDTVARVERTSRNGDGSYLGTPVEILDIGDAYAKGKFLGGAFKGKEEVFAEEWIDGWELISDCETKTNKLLEIKQERIEQLQEDNEELRKRVANREATIKDWKEIVSEWKQMYHRVK